MRCIHCGAENEPGSKFCTGCGKPLATTSQRKSEGVPENQHPQHAVIKNCIIAVMVIYGAGAVLALIGGVILGAIIGAGVCVAVYYFGYEKIKERDYKTVQNVCLGVGIAAAVFTLINLGVEDMGGVLGNGAACGTSFYAYYLLRK